MRVHGGELEPNARPIDGQIGYRFADDCCGIMLSGETPEKAQTLAEGTEF